VKYPLLAIPFTAVLLLAACGGNSTGGDMSPTVTPTPTPTPAPTVTVTAPAVGVVSFAFAASWASTNATTCTSTFGGGTDATGTVSVTETTIGSKIYSVTCTGAGGTASSSATTIVGDLPTAEGLWQGATSDSRTLSGVVMHADSSQVSNYWLVYSKTTDTSPAGFIAGTGISTASNGNSGSFASADLREFNFVDQTRSPTASGSLAAPYTQIDTLGNGTYQSTDDH
jgi:hypothetical protein